jgi:hypothetical protein
MGRSSRFGSTPSDSTPISDSLSLRLRLTRLNLAAKSKSQTHYAKGTRSDIHGYPWKRPPTACKHTVSGTISFPSLGCFSPFPHGTCSLSVASEYLALEDGPPSFPRDSTCPAVLGNCFQRDRRVSCTGLSPPLVVLSRIIPLHADFLTLRVNPEAAPQPQRYSYRWFRLFPVRSPLLRESHLISLPEGTEMYHFPSFASYGYEFTIG